MAPAVPEPHLLVSMSFELVANHSLPSDCLSCEPRTPQSHFCESGQGRHKFQSGPECGDRIPCCLGCCTWVPHLSEFWSLG